MSQKNKKNGKLPDKFEFVFAQLRNDNLEIADFLGAELHEEHLLQLMEIVRNARKLKILKFQKNKFQDEVLNRLLHQLNNSSVTTLHLQGNYLTEKSIDIYHEHAKQGGSIKMLYLNNNLINQNKVKKKMDECKKLGYNL